MITNIKLSQSFRIMDVTEKSYEMSEFVNIVDEEGEEPMELPLEDDNTLLLSTLQAQFPFSSGLKYRNPDTKAIRGIRLSEGRLYPPSEDSWGQELYCCVFPKAENKRKSDDLLENSTAKTKRMETRLRCTDLIVLGLPWKATEDSLREYFGTFGEVLMAQIKKDLKTGQSKGFGFIRFGSYEAQMRVLAQRHLIDERWCEVKVPSSKEGDSVQVPFKVFVGRCTEDISADDLREYFVKFGEVTDVFIPKPFRAFSFVTFLDPEVAQTLCGEDHIIKGVSVHVSTAAPKSGNFNNNMKNNHRGGNNGGGGGYQNDNNGGNNGGYQQNRFNHHNNGGGNGWNNNNRNNLDMPNLQSLGINPGGSGNNQGNNQGNSNNPLGGLNLNGLPMNPALVAAALNQWGLMGNMGNNQDQGGYGNSSGGGPNNSSNSNSNGFLPWMSQNNNGSQDGGNGPQQGGGGSGNHQPWRNNHGQGGSSSQNQNEVKNFI